MYTEGDGGALPVRYDVCRSRRADRPSGPMSGLLVKSYYRGPDVCVISLREGTQEWACVL